MWTHYETAMPYRLAAIAVSTAHTDIVLERTIGPIFNIGSCSGLTCDEIADFAINADVHHFPMVWALFRAFFECPICNPVLEYGIFLAVPSK